MRERWHLFLIEPPAWLPHKAANVGMTAPSA